MCRYVVVMCRRQQLISRNNVVRQQSKIAYYIIITTINAMVSLWLECAFTMIEVKFTLIQAQKDRLLGSWLYQVEE